MHTNTDTIAAISTAPGKSAISIVRISGPRAIEIASLHLACSDPAIGDRAANTFVRAMFYPDAERSTDTQQPIDEVIVLIFRAPHSYTRDDLLEIQCHGGQHSAIRILETLVQSGARPADAGEFTKRAFLAGRIDLTQAEAVIDIINAHTKYAATAALSQLRGDLSTTLTAAYGGMISATSAIEAAMDFPDDEPGEASLSSALAPVGSIRANLQALLDTWHEGQLLREGIRVVIAGRPNAGKSTLLNALARTERAIVTAEPGTTRDTVSVEIDIDGYPIQLIDTAGLRDPDSEAETRGIERAHLEISNADHILYIIDASQLPHEDDTAFLSANNQESVTVVLNKTDLGKIDQNLPGTIRPILTTLTDQTGLADIHGAIAAMLTNHNSAQPHATVSSRHRQLLMEATASLDRVLEQPGDTDSAILASDLRNATIAVGRVLGKSYDNDLLEAIFSTFCIGK